MAKTCNYSVIKGVGRKELVNPQSLWPAVLFIREREERLRLECERRVSVSKWEARDSWKVNFYTAEYMYEYFYTCKESSLLDHNLPKYK